MQPAVFLDRDDTLIDDPGALLGPEQIELRPGVAEGLRALRRAGFRLVVVTNQGGVGRGRCTEEDVDRVHRRLADLVDRAAGEADLLDRFYYCPYHPDAELPEYRRDHFWRKPRPGMILQAARDLELDLGASWMIGDRARDVEAGRAAGCRTILLTAADAGEDDGEDCRPTARAATFAEAAHHVLRHGAVRRPHRIPEVVAVGAEGVAAAVAPGPGSGSGPGPGGDASSPAAGGSTVATATPTATPTAGPEPAGEGPPAARGTAPASPVRPVELDLGVDRPTNGDRRRPAAASRPTATRDDAATRTAPATRGSTTARPPASPDPTGLAEAAAELRRTLAELVEERRTERMRQAEFGGLRLAAGLVQLLALLLAVLGTLQLGPDDVFFRWMAGAGLAQGLVIALLLADDRG